MLKAAKLGPEGYHELPLSERATGLGFEFKLLSSTEKWTLRSLKSGQ